MAKAKNSSPRSSPRFNPQAISGSGSKRASLEIFSHLRQADDFTEQARATEDEIEAMLDQNLFREGVETDNTIIKQFQIASDVSQTRPI